MGNNKKMDDSQIDFTVEENDLKCLFVACERTDSFGVFVEDCKKAYKEYHKRNSENPIRFGHPKTFSQWVNAQTIALNSY